MACLAGLALVLSVSAALTEAPSRSLVPIPRGAPEATAPVRVVVQATRQAPRASLRPVARVGSVPRPSDAPAPGPAASRDGAGAATVLALAAAVPQPTTTRPSAVAGLQDGDGIDSSPRPASRPDGLERRIRATAARLTPGQVTQPGTRGTICGTPGLAGERLQPITGRISGCGIAEPVRLRAVDGIVLTTPATINCEAARALQTWVREGLVPALGRTGGGATTLRVVASYACRTRNSQRGARLSEHARGNAIDIAGIGLANGQELSVLDHWRTESEGRVLRQLHRAACGPFGTVLGPNSDRFHRDHFHFDVASYRSGTYCR
jgi:hypothetical protein